MRTRTVQMTDKDFEAALTFLSAYTHDPVGFVWAAFPWDEDETLKGQRPQDWQLAVLQDIKDGITDMQKALRLITASGNGIGKSTLVAWIILWGITTYPDARAVITANTEAQLTNKTWPEVQKWFHKFILKDFFECTATALFTKDNRHVKNWRADAIPWSKENPEAFAGLHNQGKRIILVFDEGSAIPDIIWETAEGAMTDKNTEIIWCVFGNPTRNTGRFFECFHKDRNIWHGRQIDSRTVTISNKIQLDEWIEKYGQDSDFVRIHVTGQFPNASEYQLIGRNLIEAALKRELREEDVQHAPAIIGVDPAWTGADKFVICLRRGLYSKILGKYAKNDDDVRMANIIAGFEDEYKASAVNIDFGYGTGLASIGASMGRTWNLIPFASKASKTGYANKRAEIWGDMKEWLINGGAIENDQELIDDLIAPEYTMNSKSEILLEAKEHIKKTRGLASPNCADALALTFAINIVSNISSRQETCEADYDPFSEADYDPFAD